MSDTRAKTIILNLTLESHALRMHFLALSPMRVQNPCQQPAETLGSQIWSESHAPQGPVLPKRVQGHSRPVTHLQLCTSHCNSHASTDRDMQSSADMSPSPQPTRLSARAQRTSS